MSKTKTNNTEEVAVVETEETSIMETAGNTISNDFVIDPRDINIPRVKVIQKMTDSDLEIGCLAHEDGYMLMPREGVLQTIVLAARKAWKQDLPFDAGVMPQLFSTEEAAIDWKRQAMKEEPESKPKFLEYAELTLMFKQPEGADEDNFDLTYGDDNYAIGKIYVQKDAYKHTYKNLMNFYMYNPTTPVGSVLFDFKTKLLSQDKFTWYVPTLKSTHNKSSEEAAAFAASCKF